MLEAGGDNGSSGDEPENRDTTTATPASTQSVGQGATGEQSRLEQAAADDGTVQADTAAAPPKADDDEAENKRVQREQLKAQIDKVKAQTAERREAKRLKAEREELERAKEQLRQYHAKVEDQRKRYESFDEEFRKDPVGTLERRGIPAPLAYEKITNKVLQKTTPEEEEAARKEAWFKEWESKYGDKLTKLEEIERRQAEAERREQARLQEHVQHRQAANEREFLDLAKGNGHEILADYYEDEDLVRLGNAMADELAESGEPFTVEDVVKELASRLQAQIERATSRRTQRTAATQRPAPVETPQARPGASEQPKPGTITNDMASATSTAAKRAKTPAERRAEAERELAAIEIR